MSERVFWTSLAETTEGRESIKGNQAWEVTDY